MKDVRHEHPLNDPEHQQTCEHCQQMDALGASFAGWLEELHLNNVISDERLTTFLLLYVANVALDSNQTEDGGIDEAGLPELRERLTREMGQAFDGALRDLRQDLEGA